MDEKAIVKGILAGSEAAKEALYHEYAKRLYVTACAFLGYNDPEAEDAVQETYFSAFKDLARFEFRSSLYTWLNHICVNQCYQRLRQRRRVLSVLDQDMELLTAQAATQRHRGRDVESEKTAALEAMWRLVEKLSAQCRKILEMRHREGRPYGEIGKKLRVPIGTVMSRLSRCRQLLSKKMKKASGA